MTIQLTGQITQPVDSAPGCVHLTEDCYDLFNQRDIEHVLNQLIEMKVLSPIGEGLLAKVRKNRITDELMLDAPRDFEQVACEALERLAIKLSWSTKTGQLPSEVHDNSRILTKRTVSQD